MRRLGHRRLPVVVLTLTGMLLAACAGAGSAPARAPGASLAPSAGSGGASAPTDPPARARAAFVSIAGPVLPVWIAQDTGIYQRYGLDIDLSYIAGLAKIAEALIAGEIDLGITPAPTAIGAGIEGADLVMVACWSDQSTFSLYTPQTIRNVADLQGKRIAVSRRGSASELWASAVLAPYGLAPERDYAVLAMGGQPEQLAGLMNGAVDGAVIGVPTNLVANKQGMYELLSYKDHGLEFSNIGLVVSRRYLRDQPGVVERFLKATAEGVAVMHRDMDTAVAVLGPRVDVADREMLEETVSAERLRTPRDMIPTPGGMRGAAQELIVNNPKAADVNPEDFADLTIIRQLNDSGFIASLYP